MNWTRVGRGILGETISDTVQGGVEQSGQALRYLEDEGAPQEIEESVHGVNITMSKRAGRND
jgi:hypothetical protein